MVRRWLLAGTALVALGGAIGLGIVRVYWAEGPLASAVDVVVPRAGMRAVAAAMQDAGVVRSAFAFRVFAWATMEAGPVRAAELRFPAHSSIASVLLVLRHGRPVQHLLTIPEGVTAWRLGVLLASARGLVGAIDLPSDGMFLPESYAFERNDASEAVVRRGRGAMTAAASRAWTGRSGDLPLRSRDELVVLASLIEREARLPAERPLVAAVFLNRLRLGMRLQSDPTVVYAVTGGDSELERGLRKDDLETGSPYNTYTHAGLPPGPICNPGLESVLAAAHPAASSALYFVADGHGGHVFAGSLEEHNRNVARYRLQTR